MKEASDVTCLFVDHGLFIPLAQRLSQFYKRILYHKPGTEAFPTINRGCIGDGFSEIECCVDPWRLVDSGEIDLAVFPDILDSGMELHLEQLGIPVWGSRKGDSIELSREKFLGILKNSGLECPTYERVVGLSSLMSHLRDKTDKFIKISRWRGSMETWHWRSWALDEDRLFSIGLKFGPLREYVPFMVFDSIETDIEDGGDFLTVDGLFPKLCLRGIESKDKGYFSAVTKVEDLPDYTQEILEVFGKELKPYRYRNMFSVEVRVRDDKAYFIDPCCRGGLPATGSQMMVWSNIADFIWVGAHGDLIELEPSAQFTAECAISLKRDKCAWSIMEVPKSIKPWVKIPDCCEVEDGLLAIPPDDQGDNTIGWIVALSDSPKSLVDTMKEQVSLLPDGVSASTESLVELIQEAERMDNEGLSITDKPLPEPTEVLEQT